MLATKLLHYKAAHEESLLLFDESLISGMKMTDY